MTDKEALFIYRLKQAEETLRDAEKMLEAKLGSRSIVNRAYYSMFYAILALFLKFDVKITTSKHSGVISVFDKEFVHTGKFDKDCSKMLHKIFEARQEGDYREFFEISASDAKESILLAKKFLEQVKLITR